MAGDGPELPQRDAPPQVAQYSEPLGQAVVALFSDDDGSMMVRLHLKDVALLQTLNGLFLRYKNEGRNCHYQLNFAQNINQSQPLPPPAK